MAPEAAVFEVRVDASGSLSFVHKPGSPPLGSLSHPSAKALRQVLEARHRLDPEVDQSIKEHVYQKESREGRLRSVMGSFFCCVMPFFIDQTKAWCMDRDTDKVRKQVVALLCEILHPGDYDLVETAGLPGKRMFDPEAGGLVVLRLYIKSPRS